MQLVFEFLDIGIIIVWGIYMVQFFLYLGQGIMLLSNRFPLLIILCEVEFFIYLVKLLFEHHPLVH